MVLKKLTIKACQYLFTKYEMMNHQNYQVKNFLNDKEIFFK